MPILPQSPDIIRCEVAMMTLSVHDVTRIESGPVEFRTYDHGSYSFRRVRIYTDDGGKLSPAITLDLYSDDRDDDTRGRANLTPVDAET
jgi:hypothetical protein